MVINENQESKLFVKALPLFSFVNYVPIKLNINWKI